MVNQDWRLSMNTDKFHLVIIDHGDFLKTVCGQLLPSRDFAFADPENDLSYCTRCLQSKLAKQGV